jgi:mRNA interferase HigB
MRVVGLTKLEEFASLHADVRSQLDAWLIEAESANLMMPQDIKTRYQSASFLSENRVIFNLKGNSYRLEVKVNYVHKIVLVTRLGTHAEYSKWKS